MNLAWSNLADHPRRLVAGAACLAFVVAMMFTQLGFLHGFNDGNARMMRGIDADFLIVSARKNFTIQLEPLPWRRVQQARSAEGVASADPVFVRTYDGALRDVRTGLLRSVRVIGIDRDSSALAPTGIAPLMPALALPDTVAFDRLSRSFITRPKIGETVELCGRRLRVVGYFDLGTDIDANANVIVSTDTFERCYPAPRSRPDTRPDPEYIAVKLRPGASPQAVRRALEMALPGDAAVRTPDELLAIEVEAAARLSPLAPLLILGVVIGFAVGVVICSQILFNEVNDRLHEYATLKALGRSDRDVALVVVHQSLILAAIGFAPGVLLSLLSYTCLEAWCTLPMRMRASSVVAIGVLTFAMCLVSGWLAARRVARADPAALF
jgi:putative ABC transport system permease protein